MLCGLSKKGRKEGRKISAEQNLFLDKYRFLKNLTTYQSLRKLSSSPSVELRRTLRLRLAHQLWIYMTVTIVSRPDWPNPVATSNKKNLVLTSHLRPFLWDAFSATSYSSIKTKALTGRHGSNLKACCVTVPSLWILCLHIYCMSAYV